LIFFFLSVGKLVYQRDFAIHIFALLVIKKKCLATQGSSIKAYIW